ncbi:nucleotidyltransferase family protein [Streptomyces sp. NPDC004647]|uniref:nucleotidyltransferase family protein n=1 Tax=Streptomyces sp. NPDC004647 TaxID=3154671 RepID=UPI0033BB679D
MTGSVPEWLPEFLLAATWAPAGAQARERIAEIVARPDFDEQLALAEAERHKVLLLTDSNLAGPDGPELPSLAQAAREKRAKMAALWQEFDSLLEGLGGHGLEPVVLKGAAWANSYYPAPRDRAFGDFDLLVPEAALDRYGSTLESLGYAQATYDPAEDVVRPLSPERIEGALTAGRHAAPFIRVGQDSRTLFAVELHGPGFDHNFLRIDTTCFLDRSSPWKLTAGRAARLDPVDALIYSAANLWKDVYEVSPEGSPAAALLITFCDMRQMFLTRPAPEDWQSLYERAHGVQKCDAVHFALVHLDRLFPDVVPKTLLPPPPWLSRDPEAVVDDVWHFLGGSSTFRERLFDPRIDERRFTRLRDSRAAGGRMEIPRGTAQDGTEAGRIVLSGVAEAPPWQFFRSHVTYGARPRSDREFSATLSLEHSTDDLHVRVAVNDPTQVFDKLNGFYYAQDSVQLLFEHPLGSGSVKSFFLVPKAADLPRPAVVRHFAGLDRAGTEPVAGASISAEFSPDTYRMLARLPKSEILPGLTEDEWFGFDVVVYESGPPGQEKRSVLQWSGGRNALRNPAYFGRARFH